jgi:hypothetical protein
MEDQFDAILYTGAAHQSRRSHACAKASAEPGYVKMRAARTVIAGLPPGEAAGIEKACAEGR